MRQFDDALEYGRAGEVGISSWLQKRGWRVLPVYNYSGKGGDKAPKLIAAIDADSLVMPDLMVARDGLTRFVEVKRKGRADWTRVTQRRETGINLRLWTQYRAVQVATGIQVALLFVHDKEGEVRGGSIDALGSDARQTGCGGGMPAMVFFPWDTMPLIALHKDVLPGGGQHQAVTP